MNAGIRPAVLTTCPFFFLASLKGRIQCIYQDGRAIVPPHSLLAGTHNKNELAYLIQYRLIDPRQSVIDWSMIDRIFQAG